MFVFFSTTKGDVICYYGNKGEPEPVFLNPGRFTSKSLEYYSVTLKDSEYGHVLQYFGWLSIVFANFPCILKNKCLNSFKYLLIYLSSVDSL